MRTIVVSDVHIGYEHSDTVAFENFVDTLLAEKPDKLILLGDIFDFWRRSDADLLKKNRSIVEKLLQLPVLYVHGNHDYSMLKLSGKFPEQPAFEVKTSLTLRNQNSRFVLRHGYDLEVFTSMEIVGIDAYEAFSEAMCHAGQVGGTIASWVWAFVELVKGKISADTRKLLTDTASKPAEERPTLQEIEVFAREPTLRAIPFGLQPSDVLIFGHTHRPFKDELAANTGSWVMTKDKKDHTYIEITDQSFDRKKWPVSDQALKAILKYRPSVPHRAGEAGRR